MVNLVPHTVLVAAASRHGSTAEIAARIGNELRESLPSPSWRVHIADADSIDTIEGYDAVVLGSAIYLGRWLKSARQLLEKAQEAPAFGTWLFSSGPVAADALGSELVDTNDDVADRLRVKESIVFPGRLVTGSLGRVERAVTAAMHITDGDFRDWEAVEAWANDITRTLSSPPPEDQQNGGRSSLQ